MKYNLLLIFTWVVLVLRTEAQGIAIGQWRDHFPYNNTISVADAGNKIYAATPYALMYVDIDDNSVHKLSKVQGLSDFGLSTIGYDPLSKALVIAYSNANVDVIVNDKIYNIPDIKNKTIMGKKVINNITFLNGLAYLSCGFGIVVIDPLKRVVRDTYYIGYNSTSLQVFDIASNGDTLFAATENGIYKADQDNAFLADYHAWSKLKTLPYPDNKYNAVECFSGKLFVNLSNSSTTIVDADTAYYFNGSAWQRLDSSDTYTVKMIDEQNGHLVFINRFNVKVFDDSLKRILHCSYYDFGGGNIQNIKITDAAYSKDGGLWLTDEFFGLSRNYIGWDFTFYRINGPVTANVYSMACRDGKLWMVPGGRNDAWNNNYNLDGPSAFIDDNWYSYKHISTEFNDAYDLLGLAIDPFNSSRIFVSSWFKGILEIQDDKVKNLYTDSNSTIQPLSIAEIYRVAGLTFDSDGNLWVSNAQVDRPLSVLQRNGTWKSFSFLPIVNSEKYATSIVIDDIGQKWILLARAGGLLVFNDNNTITNSGDDQFALLNTQAGTGALPSSTIFALAKDNDGEIWIGTDHGIAVIYDPENVFSGYNYDAQQIIVERDGYTQYMLEGEIVTAIAVDGSNKKWIGTQTAGVFLISADGTEQLYHFTAENSPLPSNTITSIAINDKTGEVFFGTALGIVSFKGQSTATVPEFEEVYAYPNPVRENYTGYIAVKGLVDNTYVKITDVTGRLVYSAKAEGGQAIWNACNHKGERVKSGVYLVFCTNEDGSQTIVTKILVL